MKKTISIILALCMLVMLLPAASFAAAESSPAYIYAAQVNELGEPTSFTFEAGEAVEGMQPVGLYVFDDDYVLTEDLSDKMLIVNGVSVTVGTGGKIDGTNVFIFGDGDITSRGLFIEGNVSNSSFFDTADALAEFVMSNMDSFSLMLSGEINEIFTADRVLIRNGDPLVIKAPASGDPNGLNINGSLTLEEGASLTGEEGQILEIRKKASVTGLTLYDCDGETPFSDFSNTETFNYDSASGKWIRCGGPGGPVMPANGEFRLVYDEWYGRAYYDADFDTNFDTEQELLHSDLVAQFMDGDAIEPVRIWFDPDPNAYDENEAVSISVLVRSFTDTGDETEWAVVDGSAVSGYSFENGIFSFTPSSGDPFEILMVWTHGAYEFETCEADPEQGQKLVEYCAIARGRVEAEASEYIVRTVVDRNRGKIVVDYYAEEIVFMIEPDENNFLEEMLLGDPGVPVDLSNVIDGKYTLELGEEAYCRIEFVFSDNGPGEPPEPFAENKYEARFSPNGTVKAGETELVSGVQNDFVADAPIAFTLTPNSADAEPFVELEVFDGSAPEDETYIPNTLYDSTLEQDEPEDHRYKLALTEGENGVRSFTFTPTSSTHFEVRVYWSDKDRFDSFICGDGEKFVEYRIKGEGEVSFGDIWLGGWCSYSDEDGFEYFKQGVLKEVTSLSVAITPREGWKLDALGLAGTSLDENAYTISESGAASYVWNELDKGLDVEFAEIGGSGPEEPPVFDYAKAKQQTESRNYAYYGASADDIKAYMAQELWAELFGVLYRWNGEQFEAAHEGEFSGMFGTTDAPAEHGSDDLVCVVSDQLLSAMSFSEQKEASESNILALPYYEYTIQFPDGQTSAAGKVFILEKDKQFVVRIDDTYVLADTDGLDAEQDLVLRAQPDNDGFDVDVFGNGVCVVGGLDAGEGVWAGHVTQEHSGLDIGPINRRLVIVPAGTPVVRIEGETWAAPWGFGSVPLFPVGTQEAPTSAVVYYGNSGESGRRLYIHKAAFEGDTNPIDDADDTGNKVEIDTSRLSSEAATIIETNDGSYTFQFHTSFGVIPLIITFKDGSKGYIDLERTGLDVADCRVGDGKYRVQHGIGSTEYSSEAEHVVTGSFYYATGSETPAESVTLLVTVTTSDGTTVTEVSRMNGAFIETEGEDKWCDDFLLWSGTEAEWSSVISVTAEVAPASGTGEAAVTELSAEATASSVSFTGAADCVAVSVQLLDGEAILASVTLPVQSGAFSGKFEGLALEAEKTYTLRAASVDGGEWKSVEVEIASAPTPPTPPSPPSGGGSAAVEKYTLTFDPNGGSEIEPVTEKAGTVIDLSEYVPVRDGYTFVGWCGSPSLGDVFTEIELTQDITLYAKWRIACSHGGDCPLAAFTDLDPDAWYHEGIHFCLTRGIMNGIGGGLFDPAGKATRAQIVTMLYRLEGEPEVAGANPFSDVAEGCFYDKSTAWASAEGIVLGYGGGIFAPDDLITREQAATILYRYAEYKGVDTEAMGADTNTLSYTDVFTISEFARPAMHFCIAAGVINGDGNGYLRPSDNASRAEVAAMFQRLCDAIS